MLTPTMIELLSLIKDGLLDNEIQQGFTAGDISGYAGVDLNDAEKALVEAVRIQLASINGNGKYSLDTSKDVEEEAQKANLLTHISTCNKGGDEFSYLKLLADAGFPTIDTYSDDIKYLLTFINSLKGSECKYDKVTAKFERLNNLLTLVDTRGIIENNG